MRRLRENRSVQVPTRHLVFDCETIPVPHPTRPNRSIHLLRLGVAHSFRWSSSGASCERIITFTNPEQLWSEVERVAEPRKGLWVWAHNLGFDLTASQFWNFCERGRFALLPKLREEAQKGESAKTVGALVTEDPPTVIQARARNGALITLVDTVNYLPRSLAQIGAMIGLPKLGLPLWADPDETWEVYCRRDVEITTAMVQEVLSTVRECDLGNLRFTVASQGMAAFRHTKPTPIIDFGHDEQIRAEERNAYYGARCWLHFCGRVEAPGAKPPPDPIQPTCAVPITRTARVYRCDVNAHYPYVMCDNLYPVRYLRTAYDWTPQRLLASLRSLCAVAEVQVCSPSDPWPFRQADRVAWKTGEGRTWLCGPELTRALVSNCVRRVYRAHLYSGFSVFNAFARRMLKARSAAADQGNRLRAAVIKHATNALHGKFAQRPGRWEARPEIACPFVWGAWARWDADASAAREFRAVAGKAQERTRAGEREDSFPALAAHVASYAREHVRNLTLIAGPQGVLYEDADSLHLTEYGFAALGAAGWISSEKPGSLKVLESATSAEYRGQKNYRFGAREVVAGLSGDDIDLWSGCYRYNAFQGLNGALSGLPEVGPVVDLLTKAIPLGFVPGEVTPSGWVIPWTNQPEQA